MAKHRRTRSRQCPLRPRRPRAKAIHHGRGPGLPWKPDTRWHRYPRISRWMSNVRGKENRSNALPPRTRGSEPQCRSSWHSPPGSGKARRGSLATDGGSCDEVLTFSDRPYSNTGNEAWTSPLTYNAPVKRRVTAMRHSFDQVSRSAGTQCLKYILFSLVRRKDDDLCLAVL